MWWIQGVVGAVSGIIGGSVTRAQARNNERISAANAEANNKVRLAGNAQKAAETSLARWTQSLNNQRALDSGGRASDAVKQNFYRTADSWSYDSVNQGILLAEAAGQSAASSAAAGQEGGVVDMVNLSTRLRANIVAQRTADVQHLMSYDAAQRAGTIMSQTIGGLDNSVILDSLDYNKDVALKFPKNSVFQDAIQGAMAAYGGGGIQAGLQSMMSQPTSSSSTYSLGSARLGAASGPRLGESGGSSFWSSPGLSGGSGGDSGGVSFSFSSGSSAYSLFQPGTSFSGSGTGSAPSSPYSLS